MHLELRCSSQTVVDGAWAANIMLPEPLSFPGLWLGLLPGLAQAFHSPSSPVLPESQALGSRAWVPVATLPWP